MLLISGKLAVKNVSDARRIALYLVRGNNILAYNNIQDDGFVSINIDEQVLKTPSAYKVEAVVGPTGMDHHLIGKVPNLQRIPIDLEQLKKQGVEARIPLEKIKLTDDILKIWWLWCRWYCVNGTVLGPDGCPVPFAQVTVYHVTFTGGGFSQTPKITVTADANGQFEACFGWCRCFFCCWPCWPWWWLCWPWWWERDMLYVIEGIERNLRISGNISPPAVGELISGLTRPLSSDLARGHGFARVQQTEARFTADPARTELIQSKLARIRHLFPWWWWCCDDPNILFRVTQGANVIVEEKPSVDTRWCLESDSSVTLIGNEMSISVCPGDPPPSSGFVWTRVGNITVNNIHGGYADGFMPTDTTDLPFKGTLDLYGEFGLTPSVAYYQVNGGLWTGNPSRSGVAPSGSVPISTELYNTAVILRSGGSVEFHDVKMGPFNSGALVNLYATQNQRPNTPAASLPAFPPTGPLGPGDLVFWAYNGLKVRTGASNLINGANLGAVDLTMAAYDNAFAPISLTSNPDDKLTLQVDTNEIQAAVINSLKAYHSNGIEVSLTGTGSCPAYDIGPGGYVLINVTVTDANGHLFEYYISPDFGSGSSGTTTPGLRGYRTSLPSMFPPGYLGVPDTSQKSFVGGTEDIKFEPLENCCYDFRLYVGKRVTNGYGYPTLSTADFQTATIKVT